MRLRLAAVMLLLAVLLGGCGASTIGSTRESFTIQTGAGAAVCVALFGGGGDVALSCVWPGLMP